MGYINGTAVNFRSAPSLKAKKLRQLNRPEQIEILDLVVTDNQKYTYWYKIKTTKNEVGYVYYLLVSPDQNELGKKAGENLLEATFYERTLGVIKFSNHLPISVALLKQLFPGYTIKSGIGQGDSPDYYYFKVSNSKDMISIISYIQYSDYENQTIKTPQPNNIKIDQLKIESPTITDQYGLKTGDTYQEIIKKRGKDLERGNTHHEKYLGSKGLYYRMWGDFNYKGQADVSPETIDNKQMEKYNWEIQSVCWPRPGW